MTLTECDSAGIAAIAQMNPTVHTALHEDGYHVPRTRDFYSIMYGRFDGLMLNFPRGTIGYCIGPYCSQFKYSTVAFDFDLSEWTGRKGIW